jgi:DNA polymerase-3 subunit beta
VKFGCERDTLADAVGTASRATAGARGGSSVLTGIKLDLAGDRLQLTGTDRDLTIAVEVSVSGNEDGVAVVPARLVADIVRALPSGRVTVEVGKDEAEISSERSRFSVRTFQADDFPRPSSAATSPVTLPAAAFRDAIVQVARAASTDDSRSPVLTGVLLAAEDDGLRMVATDSYRLAVRDLAEASLAGAAQKVLLPSRALKELERLMPSSGEITLWLGEREATFEVGTSRLTTSLIEGEFPNYRQLIPQTQANRLRVGREALIEAIKRMRLLTAGATSPAVRLHLGADGLDLLAIDQEKGQATEAVDANYEGAEMTVAFNPQYLSDGVDAMIGDEVVLETQDALKPAVVRSASTDDFLYLLMPVRVS